MAAQAKVGTSYLEGTGVPRSYVDAYAWLNIAAAQGGAWFLQSAPVAIRNHIDAITKLMTPAQIAEAQKLSRELWKKYVAPFQGTALADDPLRPGDTFKDCDGCPEMVVIPPGQFRMGDLSGDGPRVTTPGFGKVSGNNDEKPIHDVHIDYSFAVGKFEVTQAEWRHVMGTDLSFYPGEFDPAENVSWLDAQKFIGKLTSRTGHQYRLLSEAEWEYAARAGTTTKYHWGNVFNASKAANNRERTETVGSYAPNAFGLHDMHSNVWEWVEDCWHDDYAGAPSDGSAWISGGNCSRRVLRGGSWGNLPRGLRAASRTKFGIGQGRYYDGFRVARTLSR